MSKLIETTTVLYDLSAENDWLPDLEALETKDLSKVKLMWVNYPHMPTGALGNTETLKKLVAFAKKHQIVLVNDNPYSFVLNDNPFSLLKVEGAKEVALELNGLSKSFNMAGWRVGMVVGKSDFIQAVLESEKQYGFGYVFGIQQGAIAALQNKDWFAQMNEVYQERKELMLQITDKLNCAVEENTSGMFVWAKLPSGSKRSEAFIDDLLDEKIFYRTRNHFWGVRRRVHKIFTLCDSRKITEALHRFRKR